MSDELAVWRDAVFGSGSVWSDVLSGEASGLWDLGVGTDDLRRFLSEEWLERAVSEALGRSLVQEAPTVWDEIKSGSRDRYQPIPSLVFDIPAVSKHKPFPSGVLGAEWSVAALVEPD